MKLNNAIILQGPGRSGTTLVNKILSFHPQVGFLSGYNNQFPELSSLSILNRLYKIEILNKKLRGKRMFPKPAEAYEFWEHYFRNFRNQPFEFTVENKDIISCSKNLREILRFQKTDKLLIKITGSARSEWINKLFNNPKVIWLERDPRAVISSFDKQNWLFKRDLKRKNNSPSSKLLEKYAKLYLSFYESGRELEERAIFYYEDLIKDPNKFFSSMMEYCELESCSSFFDYLETWQFDQSTNEIWESKYTQQEIEFLNEILNKPLTELGYV